MHLLQEEIVGGMYVLIALGIGLLALIVGVMIYASTRKNPTARATASGGARRRIKLPVVIILVILLVLVIIAIRWCSNFRYE